MMASHQNTADAAKSVAVFVAVNNQQCQNTERNLQQSMEKSPNTIHCLLTHQLTGDKRESVANIY